MAKAELKTKKTKASVSEFLAGLDDAQTRKDCKTLVGLMQAATGAKAKMWGTSIVGFGDYRYKSPATGREGDWFTMGFAPRKGTLTLYLMSGVHSHEALLEKLGKHKTGTSCLYIRRLGDVDEKVLKKLIRESAKTAKIGEAGA
jgi:hypothetical protein